MADLQAFLSTRVPANSATSRTSETPWRAARRQWLLLFAALACVVAALAGQRGLGRVDYTLYDAVISLSGRAAPQNIVIVAIDAQSLTQIGRWPWRRAVHATVLDRIAADRPHGIAFDVILSEPEAGGGTALATGAQVDGDTAFATALKEAKAHTQVVLPVLRENRTGLTLLTLARPIPAFSAHASVGHIHLELDGDGIARSAFLTEGPSAEEQLPHFALALGGNHVKPPLPGERHRATGNATEYFRDYWVHIPFAGPPGTFRRVSYADVLKGAVPAGFFKDKFVMVGATAAGLGDSYPTPVSGEARAMPGVEISANVLDGLLHQRMLTIAPAWALILFSLVPLSLLMVALMRARPARVLQIWLGLLVGTVIVSWVVLNTLHWWFAPAAALAGLALAYPLWSWLRMEAALQFLADEFGKLSREPALIGRASAMLPVGDDLLERRINEVRHGANHLRDLRLFVSESLESVPDPTLVLDTTGTVLLANRNTNLLDVDADQIAAHEGQTIDALLQTWFDQPLPWHALQSAALTQEGVELEAHNGRQFLLRAGEYHSQAGAAVNQAESAGQILTLIDISPIRLAEKSRDEALSFLSHDMRSPQSSILALLELHRLDPQGTPVPDMLDRIERYANRTLSLSEQFVQLGRAESSNYHWVELDLCGSVQESVDEIWALAHEKQISLHVDVQVGDEGAFIKGDGTMLSRVWQNLLSNAVKYSPAETTISVTLIGVHGEHGERLRVSIRDQGYGMAPDDVANLFSRFRRFQQPGQPKAEGAGLGLVFVKTVVEKHHGNVHVNSTVGKGTEFVLEFPALPPASSATI